MRGRQKMQQLELRFEEEEIWEQIPARVQNKALSLCVQMILEKMRQREGVKPDESEDHSRAPQS